MKLGVHAQLEIAVGCALFRFRVYGSHSAPLSTGGVMMIRFGAVCAAVVVALDFSEVVGRCH
jgi:hypothetical protein